MRLYIFYFLFRLMSLVLKGSPMRFSVNLHGVKKSIRIVPFAYANKSDTCEFTLYRKYTENGELAFFLPYKETNN